MSPDPISPDPINPDPISPDPISPVPTVPRLLVLTDRRQLPPGCDLVDRLAHCVRGGATHVVLRELDLPTRRRAHLAERLTDLGLTVLVARTQLAALTARTGARHAYGLHLASDAPPLDPLVRASACLVGRSCHTPADVRAATEGAGGVDYVTLGPFAPTPSKPGYQPSLEERDWRWTTSTADVPVLALGGIAHRRDAARVRELGVHGVAVMGALMRSRTPAHLTQDLREAVS